MPSIDIDIKHRLSVFYFFYYSIVGTFMPFWNLYLEDQGFNYQEIGLLSSLAIITRFLRLLFGAGLQINLVNVCCWCVSPHGLRLLFGY